jgi:glycogen debranching enzyme
MTVLTEQEAVAVLRDNDRGGFTIPTSGLYPYQWNWDSAFTAFGLAAFDRRRAFRELETLFEAQWPDGMVPHIIFRANDPGYFPGPDVWQANKGALPSSGISQPPVAASAVRQLAELDPELARPFFAKLDAWHRWWHRARDVDGAGVIGIIHPWESGRDNLPDWDAPGERVDVGNVGAYSRRDTSHVNAEMRPRKQDYDRYIALLQFGRARDWDQVRIATESPFLVADVGISAILLRAERDLRALATRFGEPTAPIDARIARLEAGFERLWNPAVGAYCSLDLRSGRHADIANSATFLAFYAGVARHREELLALLGRFSDGVRYMVPSFDPASALFDPLRYWRGPVWAPINYLIGLGLEDIGETAWAARIRADTDRLTRAHGFAEYFNPLNGSGCGGHRFSWTAAVWLAWGLNKQASGED